MPAAMNGLFDHVGRKYLVAGAGIIFGPLAILMVLGAVFLEPKPVAREIVLGCYVTNGAPTLVVERDLIRIREPDARTFTYVIEPDKTGYRLSVQPALNLERIAAGQYAFVQQRGVGYFWTLLPVSSSNRRTLHEPKDYGGRFEIVARSGETVTYARSGSAADCA